MDLKTLSNRLHVTDLSAVHNDYMEVSKDSGIVMEHNFNTDIFTIKEINHTHLSAFNNGMPLPRGHISKKMMNYAFLMC